ncbi:MAG: DUF2258 domain-containing protein [Aigarchaeota archaeon]|nr:DUF2258 domain-containing protein [Aigarchaeota archaeon]MDW8092689.1 DUF2258 domain-containing protein [Nitrososphaerota archaeon]
MLKYRLRSGLVIGGAFALKIRRGLFAQMKPVMRVGHVTQEEVSHAAGELNRFLYDVLVTHLKISKGDVVRISIEYSVEDGKIVWDLESLNLEVFRRVPEGEVRSVINELKTGHSPRG